MYWLNWPAAHRLRAASLIGQAELLDFIEREKLYGLGCGMVDLSLLAATLLTPEACLWTLDKRLAALAQHFDAVFVPVT